MSYRWVNHTAEVELEIEAPGEREVLEDALRALAELLGVRGVGRADTREVTVDAPDRPALLAAWIEELAFLAESEGFVATGVDDIDIGENNVRATVSGVLDEPPPLVKAATYHRLAFEPSDGGYVARVVLDV
ncbi:MAG TPA: archease [Solirubrobacteraceae bacterium]|nr:archease [Solirubrobacteraceae bacterium]